MRVYKIMERRGFIPPPPDSMKGIPLGLTFVSILALAAKAASTGGIERLASFIGGLVAVDPNAMDMFDVDEAIEEMNSLLGNPQKILRDKDEVAQMRQKKQQQQDQMHNSQIAAQGAGAAKTGAQAAQVLSQTQVGAGNTALNQLLSGGAGEQKI